MFSSKYKNMACILSALLFTLLFCVSGCSQDHSLNPPADSEKIIVSLKVPEGLKTRTVQVIYRSTRCTFTDHTASGKSYQRDEYQQTEIELVRQGKSDLHQAKLPIDGGGACQWRLSNITFGVTYGDPTLFGEDVNFGAGGGVTVIFDHNNSPRGGADIKVDGDLIIKKDYYPWVNESFIGKHSRDVSLLSEGYDYFFSYQALQARHVFFEPVFHADFLVSSVGPKEKKKGNYAVFTYPDGSTESVARAKPSFQKMQAIRLALESKK